MIEIVKLPEPTWEFMLEPGGYIRWQLPGAPNVFHRFMQRVLLGIIWRKIEAPRPGAIQKGA